MQRGGKPGEPLDRVIRRDGALEGGGRADNHTVLFGARRGGVEHSPLPHMLVHFRSRNCNRTYTAALSQTLDEDEQKYHFLLSTQPT